jgi:tetratricopeptide (TPR) repeat protein
MLANPRPRLRVWTMTISMALAAIFSQTSVQADDDSSWVGRKIMTREPGVWIGHSDAEFPRLGFGFFQRHVNVAKLTDMTYVVLDEKDGWLSVRHRGTQDWLPKDKAILLVDAFSFFDSQVRANPKDPFAVAHRGRAWHELREYEKALTDLTEAIRMEPDHSAWYANRGLVYDRLGEYDRAIGDYSEALRRDPTDAQAFNNRGLSYRAKKDNALAINDFNQAIRLDAKFADAFFNRGNAYKGKKEFSQAISDYNEAIRLDPKWADAYFNRANARRANKEYEQAVSDYREVIRLDREDADAFSNLAWLLATCPDKKVRDGRQAVEYAMTACDLNSWKSSYFFATLAAACAENGQFDQAVKWQKRALESAQYEKDEGKEARQRLALFEDRKAWREE